MIDSGDKPQRGRPRKTLKNYGDLTLKAMEEANQLQAEANSIALRRLEVEKKMLAVIATNDIAKVGIEESNRIIDQIKKL